MSRASNAQQPEAPASTASDAPEPAVTPAPDAAPQAEQGLGNTPGSDVQAGTTRLRLVPGSPNEVGLEVGDITVTPDGVDVPNEKVGGILKSADIVGMKVETVEAAQ